MRTRFRPYWGSQCGRSQWGTRHRSQWGTSTGPCEEQSPMQWGKALCILTLVLTRGWLWTSVCPESHPHWALILVLTTCWLWSSLGLDSCPHFGLTLILTSAWLILTLDENFQVAGYSQQTECWETYIPSLNEWQSIECFSGIYLSARCEIPRCENITFAQRPSFPESQPVCFPALSEPCEYITTS